MLLNPTANIIDFRYSVPCLDKIYIFDFLESSDSTMSLDIAEDSYQEPTSPSQPILHIYEAPEELSPLIITFLRLHQEHGITSTTISYSLFESFLALSLSLKASSRRSLLL